MSISYSPCGEQGANPTLAIRGEGGGEEALRGGLSGKQTAHPAHRVTISALGLCLLFSGLQ